MASALLGLTPRWVMLLGAVLLWLLTGASAQEPPGIGKAHGPRGREGGGGGRLGRIQGGVQPRGLGGLCDHALPGSWARQPGLGVNVVPLGTKDSASRNRCLGTCLADVLIGVPLGEPLHSSNVFVGGGGIRELASCVQVLRLKRVGLVSFPTFAR